VVVRTYILIFLTHWPPRELIEFGIDAILLPCYFAINKVTLSQKVWAWHVCVTSCYSIMSHATLILYYHASMLTLWNSIIPCALWSPQVWYYGVWGVQFAHLRPNILICMDNVVSPTLFKNLMKRMWGTLYDTLYDTFIIFVWRLINYFFIIH